MKLSLFFICLFIILNIFSARYYIQNNEFYHYVYSDEFEKYKGTSWDTGSSYNINGSVYNSTIVSHYEESRQNAENNIKYNKLLIWIYQISLIGFLISFVAYNYSAFKDKILFPLKKFIDKKDELSNM